MTITITDPYAVLYTGIGIALAGLGVFLFVCAAIATHEIWIVEREYKANAKH